MSIQMQSKSHFIAQWTIGEKTISLFHEPKWLVAFVDGKKTDTFNTKLYGLDYGINLILMFKRTIEANLRHAFELDHAEKPHSSQFFPKLCIEAQNNSEVQVSLFGRIDTRTVATGELKGLRWGVWNILTKEEQTFEVNDPITRAFMQGAPTTNEAKWENVLDTGGKIIKKPASNHYAMSAYIKRFCVRLICDEYSRIQGVAMSYVSLINKNISLDENNWAVTLVSSMDSTHYSGYKTIRGKVGHAMLACEGVKQEGPFLKYLHLTQNPPNEIKIPTLGEDEAQIVSFESETPVCSLNGPTWIRSRRLVENMLNFAGSLNKQPLKFALSKSYFSFDPLNALMGLLQNPHEELRKTVLIGMRTLADKLKLDESPLSCIDLAHKLAQKAGIIFHERSLLLTPVEQIEKLKSSPITALSSDCFDTLDNKNALREQISSSYVLLTPNDSLPDKYATWPRIIWRLKDVETTQLAIDLWQQEIKPEGNLENFQAL